MNDKVVYGGEAARKIERVVKRGLQDVGLEADERAALIRGVTVYEGELSSALTATTNGKTNPTKCKAKEWVYDPADNSDPKKMILKAKEINIVNRSNKLPNLVAGTYIIWIRIKREWRIIWADC